MTEEYPLLEYDSEKEAIIHPEPIATPPEMPNYCVVCFFQEAMNRLHEKGALRVITNLTTVIGRHPIYGWQYRGQNVALLQPGVGPRGWQRPTMA